MQLPNVVGLMKVGKAFVKANRPEIMLGTSIAASIGSTVMAGIGGYRSGKQVAKLEAEKGEPLTKTEIVQETWKNYAPAAGVAVGAVASTVGLHAVHVQEKKAIIATALAAVEEVRESARDYVNDLNESIEDNTTPKTREKIEAARLEKSASRHNGIARSLDPASGILFEQYLVRDAKSGQTVYSSQHEVEEALLRLNEELLQDGEVGLETFMSELGYEPSDDQEKYGWSGADKVRLHWDTTRTGDGRPVCVFSFDPAPRVGYDKSR